MQTAAVDAKASRSDFDSSAWAALSVRRVILAAAVNPASAVSSIARAPRVHPASSTPPAAVNVSVPHTHTVRAALSKQLKDAPSEVCEQHMSEGGR